VKNSSSVGLKKNSQSWFPLLTLTVMFMLHFTSDFYYYRISTLYAKHDSVLLRFAEEKA